MGRWQPAVHGESPKQSPIFLGGKARPVQARPVGVFVSHGSGSLEQQPAQHKVHWHEKRPFIAADAERQVRFRVDLPATVGRSDACLRDLQIELDERVSLSHASPAHGRLVAVTSEREVEFPVEPSASSVPCGGGVTGFEPGSATASGASVMGDLVETAEVVRFFLEVGHLVSITEIPQRSDQSQERRLPCAVLPDKKRQRSEPGLLFVPETPKSAESDFVHILCDA